MLVRHIFPLAARQLMIRIYLAPSRLKVPVEAWMGNSAGELSTMMSGERGLGLPKRISSSRSMSVSMVTGKWNSVSKLTGLRRNGKSCRLRWVNYLRPDLKRGNITPQEEIIIQELHALWGNRWSNIARSLPGRTDNEIKNYWRTHFKKSKPSKKVEKARARFLIRQRQEKQGQEEQQHLHQGAQQQQADMRAAMKRAEEAALAEDMEEMTYVYSVSCMLQGGGFSGYFSDGSTGDGSWGSLWNLGDVPDRPSAVTAPHGERR